MSDFPSQYADVNGVRLHYVSVGTGKLVMFVHGFPEFWAEWENQLADIGKEYQAVALDMRGYNLSSKPGGAVAWSFAMRYPDWLEKLIIINSPHPAIFARELLHNPDQQKASQYMLMFRLPEAERLLSENNYAGLISAVTQFGSKWEMTESVRSRYIEAWSQPGPQELLEVKVPTLVIWGESDQALLTGNLEGLEKYVSPLTVRRIADGSHWVTHEQPELVNSLIRDFLR